MGIGDEKRNNNIIENYNYLVDDKNVMIKKLVQ